MKSLKYILLTILLTGCMRFVEKDEFSAECEPSIRHIYINGVGVNIRQAKQGALALESDTHKAFDLIYNETESFANDVIQAIKQKAFESGTIADGLAVMGALKLKQLSLKEEDVYSAYELAQIAEVSKSTQSSKLVIVAHSQGNLFANYICKLSVIKPSVIQVANPSSITTECEDSLITFDNDPVIFGIGIAAQSIGMLQYHPRVGHHHFKEGNIIPVSLLKRMLSIAGLPVKVALSEDSSPVSEKDDVFYNHAFSSYLNREPSSRRSILTTIAKLNEKHKDKDIFRIGPSVFTNDHRAEVETPWGNVEVGHTLTLRCSAITDADTPQVIRLHSYGTSLWGDDQLFVRAGKDQGALKKAPLMPEVTGIFEKEPSPKGVHIRLRSAGLSDFASSALREYIPGN